MLRLLKPKAVKDKVASLAFINMKNPHSFGVSEEPVNMTSPYLRVR